MAKALALAVASVMLFSGISYAAQQKVQKSPKAGKAAAPAAELKLEPKAMDILKAACSRLASARSMSFTAVVTYENPSRLGPPLAYTTSSEVTLQRPDKLRVITAGDGPASEFYYDGKTMTAFAPAENLLAVADAPPTIDAALKAAYDAAAIYFPFTDLVVADPYKEIGEGLILAFYIGQSRVVGGVTTDMIAYANSDVFVQAWIGVEDRLPRMVRAIYRADPSRLRNQLEITSWRLDPAVPADAFTPANTGSALRIAFARPDPIVPALAAPQAKKKGKRSGSK